MPKAKVKVKLKAKVKGRPKPLATKAGVTTDRKKSH